MQEDRVISAVREFAYSINSGGKVKADMSALIEVTSQFPLSSFDFYQRLIRSELTLALRKSAPVKWKLWSKPNTQMTWLDLISWDGYQREKVLRSLSGAAPNMFFFSLLVHRLNDWVPQVREAARDKFLEIAKVTDPHFVVEVLCLTLSNWSSWGRIEAAEKKILLDLVCEPRIAELLRAKIISSASGPMPSLFSQLGQTPILDEHVTNIAFLAIQPSVRAKAYRCLYEGKMTWMKRRKWVWTDIQYCKGRLKPIIGERTLNVPISLFDLLTRAGDDRSSIVRKVAAEIVIIELKNIGVKARPFAEKFALDDSASVSEKGHFVLNKLE